MPPAQSPQHAPKPLEPGGGGRFFRQLLFSLIPLSLALVAAVTAEGVLRLALPDLKRAYAAPLDPEKGYGITLGHRFSLNSLGLREAEFPIEPPRGQTRVLCLGDSVTFGYGLPYESTWPKILENLLRQSHPGRDIFCINAAGNAATTHEALSVYRATMRSFGARVVVLGFCMNDVRVKRHANDLRSVGLSRRGRGLLAWRYELRRSYLFSAIDLTVTEGVKRYLYPLAGRSWLTSYPYQLNSLGMTEVAETAWHDTLHSLGQLHREVSAHGARLIVAAFPYQFQISSDARDNPYRIDEADFRIGPFDRLGRFCERNSIPFVSLLAGFGTARREMIAGRRPWDDLFIDYCHPNHTGQEIAARAVYEELLQGAYLDRWNPVPEHTAAVRLRPATMVSRVAPTLAGEVATRGVKPVDVR